MLSLFQQPFPSFYPSRHAVVQCGLAGITVFLILFLLRPFGMGNYAVATRCAITLAYGGVTFLISLLGEDEPNPYLGPIFDRYWARRFRIKYKEHLTFQMPIAMEPERCAVRHEDVKKFYDKLKKDVEKFDVDPRLMANFDETMLKAIDKVLKVYHIRELPRPTISHDEKVMHYPCSHRVRRWRLVTPNSYSQCQAHPI